MQQRRRWVVTGILVLVGLQGGCASSQDPADEAIWRALAESRAVEEAQQLKVAAKQKALCVMWSDQAERAALYRDRESLEEQLAYFPVLPPVNGVYFPLPGISRKVIMYAYRHREEPPADVRRTVYGQCLREGWARQWIRNYGIYLDDPL